VFAAGETADEEAGLLVAELDVGAHGVAVVAAADLAGLAAGGFEVLEDDILFIPNKSIPLAR